MLRHHILFTLGGASLLALLIYAFGYSRIVELKYTGVADVMDAIASSTPVVKPVPVLDIAAYNKKLIQIANCPSVNVKVTATSSARHCHHLVCCNHFSLVHLAGQSGVPARRRAFAV